MTLDEIKKLADMARIDIDEVEMKEIAKDFDAILAYVGQVQEVSKLNNKESLHDNSDNYFLKNVMREDEVLNQRGEYKESISTQFPDSESGYLKVKQIL